MTSRKLQGFYEQSLYLSQISQIIFVEKELSQSMCFLVEKNWAQKVHLWRKNDKYEVCLRGWNNPFEKALSFDEYGRPSGQQSMILGLMNEFNKSRNQIHLSLGVTWASSEKCLWNRKCFYGADISPKPTIIFLCLYHSKRNGFFSANNSDKLYFSFNLQRLQNIFCLALNYYFPRFNKKVSKMASEAVQCKMWTFYWCFPSNHIWKDIS